MNDKKFESELRSLINQCSMESSSNTPDFILAKYLMTCLDAWDRACVERDIYFDIKPFKHNIEYNDGNLYTG